MIRLKDVQFLYDPRTPSGVSKLNLEVDRGSFNALIGPSGSGKSTLLNLLSGQIKSQTGLVKTPDISRIVFRKQAELQTPNLSAIDYLTSKFIGEEKEEYEAINKARELLHDFEITHIIQQNTDKISRGESQRLWLAGLLMNDPELILLDEAFNGLDWQNRHNMLNALQRVVREKSITVIWATQLLEDTLRYAENLILLEYGRVQQTGSPEELIQKPRNRFVAKFVGKKNLILISRGNKNSEFGKLLFSQEVEQEGLLVLDPFYCGEGDLQGKVLESYFDFGRYLNIIEFKERTYLGYSKTKLNLNENIPFKLDFDSSYLLSEV